MNNVRSPVAAATGTASRSGHDGRAGSFDPDRRVRLARPLVGARSRRRAADTER